MDSIKIYCYRYMWQIDGNNRVNFKIVTDTVDGLNLFENNLKSLDGVKNIAKEYLHEYDCSKIGVFEPVLKLEDNVNA